MNREVYLDFLQTFVWSEVRAVITRRHFWLQQDGATEHTADRMREWLEGRFDDRVINLFSGRPLSSCTPDMSNLDYWLWSVYLAGLQMSPSALLEELVATAK